MRIGFYLLVPLILLAGQIGLAEWVHPLELRFYNLAFFGLAAFVVLTLKFTRRRKGFKSTPMDFLILLIALLVSLLPDPRIQSVHPGFLMAKILVLFFGFEVLVNELRGRVTSLAMLIICAMAITAVKGLL
jgi:UDP-GlcNAc:undecaprenyl-phosphate GlcNAc-1-phosphate transferase